jgi:hypothetical protein
MDKLSKKGLVKSILYAQRQNSKKRGHKPPEYTYDELYDYIIKHKDFEVLYSNWVKSNYSTDTRPSIDRLDNSNGYSFDNIQLVTWSIINRLGKEASMVGVLKFDLSGKFISEYASISMAARKNNMENKHISAVAKGKRSFTGGYIWIYTSEYSEDKIRKAVRKAKITLSGIPESQYVDHYEREILLYDLDGKFYKEFISMVETAKEVLIPHSDLKRYIDKLYLVNDKYLIYYKDKFSYDKLVKDILHKRKRHICYNGMIFKSNYKLQKYLYDYENINTTPSTIRRWCLDENNTKMYYYNINNLEK